MTVEEIVSGGQTGADRAAWDVAIALGVRYGGWVPAGRKDENGKIPECYTNLKETESDRFEVRTEYNVLDSDATLIVSHDEISGGSKHAADIAVRGQKPMKHIKLSRCSGLGKAIDEVRAWLVAVQPRKLNIAGPRASEDAEIYSGTVILLTGALLSQRSVPQGDSLTVATHLRESTVCWIRHWDGIRWQVPYWFCTLATGAAAIFASRETHESIKQFWWVCLLFVFFGSCSLVLLFNLVRYDRNARSEYLRAVNEINVDSSLRSAMEIQLPYKYDKHGIWRTATAYFGAYTLLLTLLALGAGLFGLVELLCR